ASKGSVSLKALGLVGAGAAATISLAPLAKKVGKEIGYRIEERKAGKRLRPKALPLKQVAKFLPGARTVRKARKAVKRGARKVRKRRVVRRRTVARKKKK
ncbi:MAG: hypothetical protein ACE5J5_08380, partial [Candidatus Hydrothermarchaeales archaeon]